MKSFTHMEILAAQMCGVTSMCGYMLAKPHMDMYSMYMLYLHKREFSHD